MCNITNQFVIGSWCHSNSVNSAHKNDQSAEQIESNYFNQQLIADFDTVAEAGADADSDFEIKFDFHKRFFKVAHSSAGKPTIIAAIRYFW